MPDFESGVAGYIHAHATVHVHFPIDAKGNADISCNQCNFFRRQSSTCGLNGQPCAYPNKYVGAWCPLENDEGANDESDQNA